MNAVNFSKFEVQSELFLVVNEFEINFLFVEMFKTFDDQFSISFRYPITKSSVHMRNFKDLTN